MAENPHEATAIMLLKEQLSGMITNTTIPDRIYQVVSLSAFGLYKLKESRFHDLLRFTGLNLADDETWHISSGITTCFVTQGALILTDPTHPSLIDLEHDMLKTFVLDDPLIERIAEIKFEGVVWRSEFFD